MVSESTRLVTSTSAADRPDKARWDASHAVSATPTLSRIKRATICAALPAGVEPTTLWPAWPLEVVAAELELAPEESLVDLACGRGEIGLWIARHLGVSWVGVDPSPVGLAIAAGLLEPDSLDNGSPAPRTRRLVEGHFLDTGLDDATADAVLIVDALHFAPDLRRTFAEVARIVRPGRRLVIVGPQMTDPRDALQDAGFTIERDEQTSAWRELLAEFLALARADEDALRSELDETTADQLLTRDVNQLTTVGHGIIAARSAA